MPTSTYTPVFDADGITIYHGDCLKVMHAIKSGSIDAIITDPPYGIEYQHSGGGNSINGTFNRRNGKQPIVGDDIPFDPSYWMTFPKVLLWGADHFRNMLLDGGTMIAWDKSCGKGPADSFSDCEFAWTNLGVKRNVFRWLWKGLICHRLHEDSHRYHPTQKPVALMRYCLDILKVPKGGTVLDPYFGSGTTAVACYQTGRKCIGIEIDKKYTDLAIRRIQDLRGGSFKRQIERQMMQKRRERGV